MRSCWFGLSCLHPSCPCRLGHCRVQIMFCPKAPRNVLVRTLLASACFFLIHVFFQTVYAKNVWTKVNVVWVHAQSVDFGSGEIFISIFCLSLHLAGAQPTGRVCFWSWWLIRKTWCKLSAYLHMLHSHVARKLHSCRSCVRAQACTPVYVECMARIGNVVSLRL